MKKIILLLYSLILSFSFGFADEIKLPLNPLKINDPLIGKKAPVLVISEWINGTGTTLEDLKGKVVVLEFFQLWCPGCNSFSIPLMEEWKEKYSGEKDIFFMSVHTVFEGHDYQKPRRLKKFVKDKGIDHLVGIDAYNGSERVPITMKKYNTGGTPSMAILDKNGIIRFKFLGGFNKEPVEELIDYLLVE